jgi:Flp pilus assembly protein TadD/outer membrane protein OmpA-like peptidoglycan-associated protein
MKRQGIKSLAFVAAAGVLATSCDLLKDLDYAVTPDPLEMHGDSVKIKVEIKVPEKGIRKKAYAEINPMVGDQALKPITIVGEKATANGKVIEFKPGGKAVYEDKIAYTPSIENADLTISGKVFKGDKAKGEIEETKIADATIITPFMVAKDFRVIFEKDQFQRVTEETQVSKIHYLKNSPVVRPNELRDADILEMERFLAQAQSNPKVELKNIKITGFASIEGEEDRNNTLSQDRAKSALEAVVRIAKKNNVKNELASNEQSYTTVGKGEDYEGFKEALLASNMDKGERDLIIRVLEMYSSPAQRETEIRNLGKTFVFLENNIFPKQRRSVISLVYDQIGYSDEELVALSKSNIDTLNIEEILFTATLTDDLNEKLRLFKEAERMFPNDHRPANNVGAVLYIQNKLAEAKAKFEKSMGIKESTIAKNNLAAIAGVNGDRNGAKQMLAEAAGAGDEVKYNHGILQIQDGDYDGAVANFGNEQTFNKALAQLLNKDHDAAMNTIDASEQAETAEGYYLKAIVGARQEKVDVTVSNLKNAFAKDASLKAKAAKDREFVKFFEDASFSAIVK